MNKIQTTLNSLVEYYGVSLEDAGFDEEDGDTYVELWKGVDNTIHEGWHASAPYSNLDLIDEALAPQDDQHAKDIFLWLSGAAGLAQQQ